MESKFHGLTVHAVVLRQSSNPEIWNSAVSKINLICFLNLFSGGSWYCVFYFFRKRLKPEFGHFKFAYQVVLKTILLNIFREGFLETINPISSLSQKTRSWFTSNFDTCYMYLIWYSRYQNRTCCQKMSLNMNFGTTQ